MIIWLENLYCVVGLLHIAAATTAKSLQSCPTLCDPTDGNPSGSPVPGSLQARTLEWVAISFSKAWKWKVKGWTAAYQAPLSMGFSRQEYWSGVPSPSLCYTLIVYILKLFYHFLPKCLHESVIQKFRSSKKKSSNLSISYKKVLMKKKSPHDLTSMCHSSQQLFTMQPTVQSCSLNSWLGVYFSTPLFPPWHALLQQSGCCLTSGNWKWRWLSYGQKC